MEQLQIWCVFPISSISVWLDLNVGVCSILHCEICSKVPKSTIVCVTQWEDRFTHLLGVFSSMWDVMDEGESVFVNVVKEGLLVSLHDIWVRNGWLISLDVGFVPENTFWFEEILVWGWLGVLRSVKNQPFSGESWNVVIRPVDSEWLRGWGTRDSLDVFWDQISVKNTLVCLNIIALITLTVISEPEVETWKAVSVSDLVRGRESGWCLPGPPGKSTHYSWILPASVVTITVSLLWEMSLIV